MPAIVHTAKLLAGTDLRFISDRGAKEPVIDCAGCSAPCCRLPHVSVVVLSLEEAQVLPHVFGTANLNGRTVENVALLPRHPVTKDCIFVTPEGKCSIWSLRPKACRVYSCLTDPNLDMREFASKRFGTAA